MFVLGVVLFALGIAVSIALHEAGHMWTAKAFGMRVRRYYIGFGPRIFSFRRGETEYGLKAIPLGGYCRIIGMTNLEEVPPEIVLTAGMTATVEIEEAAPDRQEPGILTVGRADD